MSAREFVTRDVEGTRALGAALGKLLCGRSLVLLEGALGAGKTAFAQGLAIGLGIDGRVPSPSFTIVRQYDGGPGRPSFVHVDLYRVSGPSEVVDLGLEESLDDDCVVAVEWPSRSGPIEADCTIVVGLVDLGEHRVIRVSGGGPAVDLIEAIATPPGVAEQ